MQSSHKRGRKIPSQKNIEERMRVKIIPAGRVIVVMDSDEYKQKEFVLPQQLTLKRIDILTNYVQVNIKNERNSMDTVTNWP